MVDDGSDYHDLFLRADFLRVVALAMRAQP